MAVVPARCSWALERKDGKRNGARLFRKRDFDLVRDGAYANATVIDKKLSDAGVDTHPNTACSYRLLVRFGDGSTTEIVRSVEGSDLTWLSVGDTLTVQYDPDDHSHVEIDRDGLRTRRQSRESLARRETVAAAADDAGGSTPAAAQLRGLSEWLRAAMTDTEAALEAYERASANGDYEAAERCLVQTAGSTAVQDVCARQLLRLWKLATDRGGTTT
jgi:hypothetical protein